MDRIRELRTERGLSQAKLAVMAGMDPATFNRLEQGKGNPNLRTLERVAEALGVSIVELLEEEAPKVEAPPSPDRSEGGRAGTAALAAWSEYLDALLKRAEELRKDFLALRDLDERDPEAAEHRIDITFAVALEFALSVGQLTDAHVQSHLTRIEGERLTPEELQQLGLVFRRSNELLGRCDSFVAFIEAVRALARDMAIKKAVEDLLDDVGIPDWDAASKDV